MKQETEKHAFHWHTEVHLKANCHQFHFTPPAHKKSGTTLTTSPQEEQSWALALPDTHWVHKVATRQASHQFDF